MLVPQVLQVPRQFPASGFSNDPSPGLLFTSSVADSFLSFWNHPKYLFFKEIFPNYQTWIQVLRSLSLYNSEDIFYGKIFFNLKFANFMETYDHGIPQNHWRSWVKWRALTFASLTSQWFYLGNYPCSAGLLRLHLHPWRSLLLHPIYPS